MKSPFQDEVYVSSALRNLLLEHISDEEIRERLPPEIIKVSCSHIIGGTKLIMYEIKFPKLTFWKRLKIVINFLLTRN